MRESFVVTQDARILKRKNLIVNGFVLLLVMLAHCRSIAIIRSDYRLLHEPEEMYDVCGECARLWMMV